MTHSKNHKSNKPKKKSPHKALIVQNTEGNSVITELIKNFIKDLDVTPFVYSLDGIEFITALLKSKNLPSEEGVQLYNKFISAVFAPPKDKILGIADVIIVGAGDPNDIIGWYRKNLDIIQPAINSLLERKYNGKEPRTALQKKILKTYEESTKEEQIKQTNIKVKFYGFETTINKPEPADNYSIPIKPWITKYNALAQSLPVNVIPILKESKIKPNTIEYSISNYIKETIKKGAQLFKANNFEALGIKSEKRKIVEAIAKAVLDIIDESLDIKSYKDAINICFENDPVTTVHKLDKCLHSDIAMQLADKILTGNDSIEIKKGILKFKLQVLYAKNHDEEIKKIFETYLYKNDFHSVLKNFFISTSELYNSYSNEEVRQIHSLLRITGNEPILSTQRYVLDNIPKTKIEIESAVRKGFTEKLLSHYANSYNCSMLNHTFKSILKLGYNLNFFLPFTLSLIHSLDNVTEAKHLYDSLYEVFKNKEEHKNEIEKISRAKDLYIFLNKVDQTEKITTLPKVSKKESEDLDQKELDSENLANEAKNFISENLPSPIQVEISTYSQIHKAYQLQKKLSKQAQEKQEPSVKKISWSIQGAKYIFDSSNYDNNSPLEITTSFGTKIYATIKKETLSLLSKEQVQKFTSAINHWANGFYNKSGIKALYVFKKLCGYEVKIMNDDKRLFTNQSYKNESDKKLLIFDQLIGHSTDISSYKYQEIKLGYVGDVVEDEIEIC